jgi:hypothetical protein
MIIITLFLYFHRRYSNISALNKKTAGEGTSEQDVPHNIVEIEEGDLFLLGDDLLEGTSLDGIPIIHAENPTAPLIESQNEKGGLYFPYISSVLNY